MKDFIKEWKMKQAAIIFQSKNDLRRFVLAANCRSFGMNMKMLTVICVWTQLEIELTHYDFQAKITVTDESI